MEDACSRMSLHVMQVIKHPVMSHQTCRQGMITST